MDFRAINKATNHYNSTEITKENHKRDSTDYLPLWGYLVHILRSVIYYMSKYSSNGFQRKTKAINQYNSTKSPKKPTKQDYMEHLPLWSYLVHILKSVIYYISK